MNLDLERDLTGQVALVAGTDFAVDLVIAQALAARGATVVWGSNARFDGGPASGPAPWLAAGIHPLNCEPFCHESVASLIEHTKRQFGPIDILVHHLADPASGAWDTRPGWSASTVLMVSSAFLLTLLVAMSSMLPRQRGRIICVTSPWDPVGQDALALQVCRDGYRAIADSCRRLASEWADSGVSVNHVSVDAVVGGTGRAPGAAEATVWPTNGWSLADAVTLFGSCRGVGLTGHTVSAHIEAGASWH